MNQAEQRIIELTIEQIGIDFLRTADPDLGDVDFRARLQWDVEGAMNHLRLYMMLPSKVLQKDRVIAEYPKTLWDHIKAALGLKHRTVQVYFQEVLYFPKVKIPPELGPVRVGTEVHARTADPFYEEGSDDGDSDF